MMRDHKEDSRRAFDKMAPDYENSSYGNYSKILYDKILRKTRLLKHDTILDLGCGKGLLLEMLKKYTSSIYGADISPEMIRYAQEKLGKEVDLKTTDSENLPWKDHSFDLITCCLSFHHYPDPEKSLDEIRRLLKNGGHFIAGEMWIPFPLRNLSNYLIKTRLNKSGDVRIYSKKEWLKMLGRAGFFNIEIEKNENFTAVITAEIKKNEGMKE